MGRHACRQWRDRVPVGRWSSSATRSEIWFESGRRLSATLEGEECQTQAQSRAKGQRSLRVDAVFPWVAPMELNFDRIPVYCTHTTGTSSLYSSLLLSNFRACFFTFE